MWHRTIAQTVAPVGPFGMRIRATRRHNRGLIAEGGDDIDVDRLLGKSDGVSLHCTLTSATEGLVNTPRLPKIQPSGFLINTARCLLVQETGLAAALHNGRIAGAGLDVLSREPPLPINPLLTARNGVVTSHIAWATRSAAERLRAASAANIAAFLARTAQNLVNIF